MTFRLIMQKRSASKPKILIKDGRSIKMNGMFHQMSVSCIFLFQGNKTFNQMLTKQSIGFLEVWLEVSYSWK